MLILLFVTSLFSRTSVVYSILYLILWTLCLCIFRAKLDAQTTAEKSELSDGVFGTNGDPVNLKSQYKDCSHNQLIFNPVPDSAGAGTIQDGVTEVTIAVAASLGNDGLMNNAITVELNAAFGVMSPSEIADHLLYCLPANTLDGIANAMLNG